MPTIWFDKMQGSGNDFMLIDNRAKVVPDSSKPDFARRFCPRATAVGADGVIFLEDDPEFDFSWSFWNADGSEAEMCGNGARCMAIFANKKGAAGAQMVFRTVAGPIQASLVPGGARVQLTDAGLPEKMAGLEINGRALDIWFLNTGVPHAAVPVDDLEGVDVRSLGRAIRRHARFAPAGTNANFIVAEGDNRIAMRTYERGVEDETLACGTGAVACAIIASRIYGVSSPVCVRARSGALLSVSYELEPDRSTRIFLEGPAACVYEGRLDL